MTLSTLLLTNYSRFVFCKIFATEERFLKRGFVQFNVKFGVVGTQAVLSYGEERFLGPREPNLSPFRNSKSVSRIMILNFRNLYIPQLQVLHKFLVDIASQLFLSNCWWNNHVQLKFCTWTVLNGENRTFSPKEWQFLVYWSFILYIQYIVLRSTSASKSCDSWKNEFSKCILRTVNSYRFCFDVL